MYHVMLFSYIKLAHKDVTSFYEFLSPFVDKSTAADGHICLTNVLQSDLFCKHPA